MTVKNVITTIVLFLLIVSCGSFVGYTVFNHQKDKNRSNGTYPKFDFIVVSKYTWNDITVTFDNDKISESKAKNIFKAEFEKYGATLETIDISEDNNDRYQVTMHLKNKDIKTEFLDK